LRAGEWNGFEFGNQGGRFLPALRKKFEGCEGAEVIGVDSISAGGCRVKSRSSSVDLTVGTQLDLIELALIQDKQES